MTGKHFGPAESSVTSRDAASDTSPETWPEVYATPQLKRFGTLTELTLSGTKSGNFETNVLTAKYKPKPKS